MTAAVDVAPASSRVPGHDPQTTVAGYSEAFILACVFAGHDRPIDNLHMLPAHATGIVRRTLGRLTHDQITAWQQRIEPALWAVRWGVACRLVGKLYANDLPDAADLPDYYKAEFPALSART